MEIPFLVHGSSYPRRGNAAQDTWAGDVFLALIHERPSARGTGSASPFCLFNRELGERATGKAITRSELGLVPHEWLLKHETSGSWSALRQVMNMPRTFSAGVADPQSVVRHVVVTIYPQ